MSGALVIVNAAVAVLLSPLFDGFVRKMRAVIHSRKGPPVTQTYMDVLKLLGKEDLRCTESAVFRFAPTVALAAFVMVALLTPMTGPSSVGVTGDVVTWVYFLTLGAASLIVMASSSGNPFAVAGGARETMMLLSVEPVVVAALITAAVKSGSLRLTEMAAWNLENGPTVSMVCAGVAYFLALQATMGKLPFDIPEAESEIVGGPLIEQSGPSLAVLKLALLARQTVCCFLLVQVFAPWPGVGFWPLAALLSVIKVVILFLIATVIETVSPRLRVDQAMNYMGRVLFVALAALAFASIGV
ncbi:MAG: respiratory chain complex I subunit 1 family protein [Armatimonadota bacterium]